jgi:hypothetical protein
LKVYFSATYFESRFRDFSLTFIVHVFFFGSVYCDVQESQVQTTHPNIVFESGRRNFLHEYWEIYQPFCKIYRHTCLHVRYLLHFRLTKKTLSRMGVKTKIQVSLQQNRHFSLHERAYSHLEHAKFKPYSAVRGRSRFGRIFFSLFCDKARRQR